jgi:predicted nucleic acid-binding protein
MRDEAVVNASPLIFFSRGGHFDLLRACAARVLVPVAVVKEISARGAHDPTVLCLRNAPWLEIIPEGLIPPSILSWGLGAGESAVLAAAMAHPGRIALLDDMAGRRCAVAHGLPIMGTLGVVLEAKKTGRLLNARPVLEDLLRGGMYLRRSVLDAALALVGE